MQSPQDLINHGTYVVAGEGEAFEPAQYGDVTLGVDDGEFPLGSKYQGGRMWERRGRERKKNRRGMTEEGSQRREK